jgi:hypothetical protein
MNVGFQVLTEQTWKWLPSVLLYRVTWWNFTDISEALAASIIRSMNNHMAYLSP